MELPGWQAALSIPAGVAFCGAVLTLLYVYLGYPVLLMLLPRRARDGSAAGDALSVSVIIPAHNEEAVIEEKLRNTLELSFPPERRQVVVVSDGSTDRTNEIVGARAGDGVDLVVLPARSGKAAALNAGLEKARNDIVVFSDASIVLDPDALQEIVRPFRSSSIGCVSGEDHIVGGGGEGLYGRYELYLRNLESHTGSLVGASGCFYAQRRELCKPFPPGMAPDFLSVLETVDRGKRAITEPTATGVMRSVRSAGNEYRRKVRTMLRGITALMHYRRLCNPFRHGLFAVKLISHKILRWLAGVFMVLAIVASAVLAWHPLFRAALVAQAAFYALALVGWCGPRQLARHVPFRVPFFFCMVNLAALAAVVKYASGERQELWEPSRR